MEEAVAVRCSFPAAEAIASRSQQASGTCPVPGPGGQGEELSPPPLITFRGRGGGGVCPGFLSALGAAQAVSPANPSGGPSAQRAVPSPSPRK